MAAGFLGKRLKRAFEENDSSQDEFEKTFRHSTYYHRFFEDYCEERDGGDIRRTYIGDYFQRDCSDRRWLMTKIVYSLVSVAALVSYLAPYSLADGGGHTIVAIANLMTVLTAVFFVVTLISCATAKRRMTVFEYATGFHRMPVLAIVLAGFMTVSSVSSFFVAVMGAASGAGFLPSLGGLLGAGLLVVLVREERKVSYLRIPSGETPGMDSVTIK